MARKKAAAADQETTTDAPNTPKRVKLRNTKRSNGQIGAIARPLTKDADKWRSIGWVDAD